MRATKAGQDQALWGLAGLTDSNGELGRPLDLAHTRIPARIELDVAREGLCWKLRDGEQLPQDQSPSGMLLNTFVKLVDATPDQILEFARRHGVLNICEHDLPSSHNPSSRVFYDSNPVDPCYARRLTQSPYLHLEPVDRQEEADEWHWEPFERWRYFAGKARAMLNIAARLHMGMVGRREDWDRYHSDISARERQSIVELRQGLGRQAIGLERASLADHVTEWLEWGGVKPELVWDWEAATPKVELYPYDLFGTLAMQLTLAISRSDGLAICSACGQAYIPKRRPRAGQRHYCPECSRATAVRDAMRDYRRRQREAKLTQEHEA